MSSEVSEFLRNLFPHGSPMAQADLATKVEARFHSHQTVVLKRVIWLIDTLDDGKNPAYRHVQDAIEDVIAGRMPLPERRL